VTGEADADVAFDPVADYVRYVDGKPRVEGVRVSGGVDRTREEDALREHGADIFASDLAELLDAAGGKAAR
jgi:hypothetical protein